MGSFRNTKWDPVLLITQICAMQCLLYASLGAIMWIMDNLAGANHTLDHLFQYHVSSTISTPFGDSISKRCKLRTFNSPLPFQEVHITDWGGRLVVSAFVINSLVGAGALWLIVRRTKLCLDFSCTFQIIHLLICWYYNSTFPTAISWWMLNAVCAAIMCVCGEFLCLKAELAEIPVGYQALNQKVDL